MLHPRHPQTFGAVAAVTVASHSPVERDPIGVAMQVVASSSVVPPSQLGLREIVPPMVTQSPDEERKFTKAELDRFGNIMRRTKPPEYVEARWEELSKRRPADSERREFVSEAITGCQKNPTSGPEVCQASRFLGTLCSDAPMRSGAT